MTTAATPKSLHDDALIRAMDAVIDSALVNHRYAAADLVERDINMLDGIALVAMAVDWDYFVRQIRPVRDLLGNALMAWRADILNRLAQEDADPRKARP